MLELHNIGRRFGSLVALREVSFSGTPGAVIALLGANGAGKTTLLRILAGLLEPSSGRASLCGHDLVDEPVAARATIGYLPERVALPPEARVDEHLAFRAALAGLPSRQRQARIDEALAAAAIEPWRGRLIGQLSRGYAQRVGLAAALLHRPPVLLLDEPTEGLDPEERAALLARVRELARERTVLLSTHVLSEVEQACGRVIILARGQLVDDGPVLPATEAAVLVEAHGEPQAIREAITAVPGVRQVTIELAAPGAPGAPGAAGESIAATRLLVRGDGDLRAAVARAVHGCGGSLRELTTRGDSLGERFARATAEAAA